MEKYLETNENINMKLISLDKNFSKIINKDSKVKIKLYDDEYLSLVKSIIGQQLSGKAADSIYSKVFIFFDKNILPENILAANDENLRELGLSYPKIKYLKNLSKAVIEGSLKFNEYSNLTNDEIIDELVQVKGIGEWTAQMFLIFTLGRENVFSPGDNGLQKAIKNIYNLDNVPSKSEIIDISNKWNPIKTYASLYLWQSLNNR